MKAEANPPTHYFQKIMHIFRGCQAEDGSLRSYLVGGAVGVFVLQTFSTGLGFVTNMLLARFLGVAEYGVYTYIFAWTGLLTVLAMFGFGNVLIREIATYRTKEEWGGISGILRWVGTSSLLISLAISTTIGFLLWIFHDYVDPSLFPTAWIALPLLPVLTLFNLIGFAMRGIRKVILAQIASVLIRTPLFIILLLAAYWFLPNALTASTAITLGLFALIISLLVAISLLRWSLPAQVKTAAPHYQKNIWVKIALPLLLVAGLYELNSRLPVLMLGSISGIETAGIYSVSVRITTFTIFVLNAVNVVLSPVIASLYTTGEMGRLQRIVTFSTRGILLVTLFIVTAIILLRHRLLFLFGSAFQQADLLIIILSIGQLINVAAGSVGFLLMMTGHEKKVLSGVGISIIVTTVLNIVLIPKWGVNGAGVSAAISLVIWNVILVIQVIRLLGIDPTIFGAMSKWKMT